MAEVVDVMPEPMALARRQPNDVLLMPVQDIKMAKHRLEELQQFCAEYLQESKDGGVDGGDYGSIPGAGKKKVLFKSGGEKLTDIYGLAPRYVIVSKVEEWADGLFDYTIQCELYRKTDEMFVGSGLGSCSSWESKYRWRDQGRKCPQCGGEFIIKGKAEYGGGWLCWVKKGGCGAKFSDTDPAITGQVVGRIENPDLVDSKNTVLKIAKKRAFLDAVIAVTRSSGLFTQDLDDFVSHDAPADVMVPTEPKASSKASPVTSPPTQTVPSGGASSPVETHAQKVARIKAEAAKQQPVPSEPTATPSPSPATAEDGWVQVAGINTQSGPMIMKDGKQVPSWGPLFIVRFDKKVRASDGTLVMDAGTLDEALALKVEEAKAANQSIRPVVEPGKRKGAYRLASFS